MGLLCVNYHMPMSVLRSSSNDSTCGILVMITSGVLRSSCNDSKCDILLMITSGVDII